jgi:BlaI family transcriptional regulator, penicillinase repressor
VCRPLGTVRTLLRVLEAKGYVKHQRNGKAYVYRAAAGRRKAQSLAVRSTLTRFFAGSAQDLVLRLIEDEHLSQEQLVEPRRSSSVAPGRKLRK